MPAPARRPPPSALAALLFTVLAACAPADAPPAARYANASIVLISLDTVRADAVAGYGADPAATPVLAALAEESLLFETAIAASHHTAPSHASLFTGFSPFVHGVAISVGGRIWSIPEGIPTLAETLGAAGYATAAFTDGIMLVSEGGFARGFDVFSARTEGLDAKLEPARAFLAEARDRPAFLFAHTYRAHQPYRAPADLLPPLVDGYDGVFREPAAVAAALGHADVMRAPGRPAADPRLRELRPGAARDATDEAFLHELYEAGVVGVDREFGRFLAMLRESGVLDRAILVVTSDHGEAFFEHGVGGHSDVFDEVLRVPLLVRFPDGHRAGERVRATFAAIDLMPTLLELVGVAPQLEPEGRSLARALLAGDEPVERPAFAAWFFGRGQEPTGTAMRTRELKRIEVHADGPVPEPFDALGAVAVFDLARDPGERVDVADESGADAETLAAMLAERRSAWAALRARLGVGEAEGTPLTREQLEALEAVGYLGGGDDG